MRLGQSDEVVVVELDAPALVGGVLGQGGAPNRLTDGMLLSGVGAQLAAENGHRIGALAQGPVVPALDGREPEYHGEPVVGCRQVRAASPSIAAFSSPLPGGAANSWPMTEKRKCAHRS